MPRTHFPWKRFVPEARRFLIITVLLVGFKWWFDDTNPGKVLKGAVYTLLQSRLTGGDEPLPVAVVDISNLDPQQKPGRMSPREQLTKLIDRIAAEGPFAIGIDVDFSPDGNNWTDRGGPQFFEHLAELKKKEKIPVYLGVGRSQYEKPEEWLGIAEEEDKDLAAAVAVPQSDNTILPLWIARGERPVCSANAAYLIGEEAPAPLTVQDCLLSMSAQLALNYPSLEKRGSCWWLVQCSQMDTHFDKRAGWIAIESFTVDYGAAQRMKEQVSQAIVSAQDVVLAMNPAVKDLRDKVVILGNTQWETTLDKYPIPPWLTETPGVFFHASGAYTLIKGPLRVISPLGKLCWDVMSAGIAAMLLYRFGRNRDDSTKEAIQWRTTWALLILVATFSYGLVKVTRILWTDWLWICIALLIQGWLDKHLKQKELRRGVSSRITVEMRVEERG